MYTYNYMHIWRAARNVKTTPANNYGAKGYSPRNSTEIISYSNLQIKVFGFASFPTKIVMSRPASR